MKKETLLDPVPVRFSGETKKRLAKTAKRFGLNSSEMIRRAVEHKLPEWETSEVLVIAATKEAK